MSKDVSNGSETTSIEILQLRSSDNSSVVLHLAKCKKATELQSIELQPSTL